MKGERVRLSESGLSAERGTDTDEGVKPPRLQMGLFAALSLVFLGCLAYSASHLPARLATHFGSDGQPNGWMNRSSLLIGCAALGYVFPLYTVALCWLARLVPDAIINLPHKEHWLAAEHRQKTFDDLFSHSWWFACLAIGFVIGMYLLLVQSNRQTPPHLSTRAVWELAGGFLAGTTVWTVALVRHFSRPAP